MTCINEPDTIRNEVMDDGLLKADNRTTETDRCDGCGIKKIYKIVQESRSKASKLAREIIKAAREQRVDIGELIKYIANEYAASEASYAEREACKGSYNEGYDNGFADGRGQWLY